MKLHFSIRALVLPLLSVGAMAYAADVVYENGDSTTIERAETWSGNSAETVSVSNNEIKNKNRVGAIHLDVGGALTIEQYGEVNFKKNKTTHIMAGGSALSMTDKHTGFTLQRNGTVSFENNVTTADDYDYSGTAYGGAIFGKTTECAQISSNTTVSFSKNSASAGGIQGQASGGAIYMEFSSSDLTISDNKGGVVSFVDNSATAAAAALGGAIYFTGDSADYGINLSSNDKLEFKGNKAESDSVKASGGAIYTTRAKIIGNKEVIFDGNSATLKGTPRQFIVSGASGGALCIDCYDGGSLQITGNTKVSFTNNYISDASESEFSSQVTEGGAIYASGDIEIQGNDSVVFSNNYKHKNNVYTMNAVYAEKDVVISANKDGKVEFYDGVIVLGDADLNSSYEGKEQTGEIVFSGANVETNLQAIKTAAGAGDVTAEEIERSRQFSFGGSVTLHAGTLMLDEAVLAAESFIVKSGAAVKLNAIDAQKASLTLKENCIFEDNSNVILLVTEKNAGALTSKSNAVSFLVADVAAITDKSNLIATADLGVQWECVSDDFDWKIEDGKTWITGTVNAVTNIVVDEEINLSESISDVADGTKRSITVENTTATLSGNNTHTGGTAINNAKVTVGSESALGGGEVYLRENAALDLGGFAIDNRIHAEDSTISGTEQYNGDITISGDLTLTDDTARAAGVTLTETGSLTGKTLVTQNFELRGNDRAIETNLSVTDGGSIVLHAGNALTINGNLTIGKDVCIILLDGGYAAGDTLLSWTGTLTGDVSELLLEADEEFILKQEGKRITLAVLQEDNPGETDKPIDGPGAPSSPEPMFDQDTADVPAQGNWGIFTASRAFVSAVQGQRNNMGCIAGGRGTAWASLLGGMTDISGSGAASGSDITLFGAAVGVDMKVGKRSSLGVAFGYTDGEVSADGLGDIDQETGHLALYGEHGLKKFADNSCLSLDWVAATGTTESKYRGTKWEQDSVQLNARLTRNKQVTERFSYNVFGGVEYFASESDRVQNCKSGSVQNLRGELGAGVRYVAVGGSRRIADGKSGMVNSVPGCERVVLYGEVSYINDMVRNNPSIEVNGLRGSGANPGRQGAGVEAGATIRLGERWSANANYSFNAMDDSHEHILNIGASRTF